VKSVLKKLALGMALIVISAAILLYSDIDSRRTSAGAQANPGRPLKVALVQHSSIPALDDGVNGALDGLKERGYVDGGRMTLRRYNAQGDISVANAIAKDVTSGDYDLILSISTVSLQTVANANRVATPPRRHVFGLVTDPYVAGVGISRENHLNHPPYMTGVGSLAPIEDVFRLAKQLNPSLKKVGLVWDPSESNSVVATNLGRSVCAKLGLTLEEANAESPTEIGDAVSAVISRKVDAIWVSPDQVALRGMDVIQQKAMQARIPVFSSIPTAQSKRLFDLGADYLQIGHVIGGLAADVLDGRSPATIPVDNVMPVALYINKQSLKGLRDHWAFPDSVAQRADVIVDDAGRHTKQTAQAGNTAGSR
jgi:putative tryptophan/tyrosine transport system substrate-binding protein